MAVFRDPSSPVTNIINKREHEFIHIFFIKRAHVLKLNSELKIRIYSEAAISPNPMLSALVLLIGVTVARLHILSLNQGYDLVKETSIPGA